MIINFHTTEKLIFENKKVQEIIPHFGFLFNQWAMGKQIPSLKFLCKRSILDLLNSLTDNDIQLLESFFGERVEVKRLEYGIVKTLSCKIDELSDELEKLKWRGNFSMYRKDDIVYLLFWR